ncbi:MAG: tetratricopeptide repeat protein [Cyclobacteriaceae bacterium]|nr:tetratricopeptide repeat protein [Cyclobacteriaceae bacterium]
MFRYLFILITSFGVGITSQAAEKVDSLRNLLANASIEDSIRLFKDIGEEYFNEEDYKNSIDYFFSSLNLAETYNNIGGAADASNSIGSVYYNTENYPKALTYYDKALDYYRKTANEERQGTVYNNLALVYYETDSLDKAIGYYNNALRIKKKFDLKLDVGAILHNLGLVYMHTKNFSASIKNLMEAREIFSELNNTRFVANATNNIGRSYFKFGKYEEALTYFEKGIEEARAINSSFLLMDNYKYQADCYAKMEEFQKAYWFSNEYYNLKDSLLNIDKEKELAEIQAKYENEKRQRENELLKKENENKAATIKMQYLGGIGIFIITILSVILALIYYRGNKNKQKANELLTAQKLEIEQKNRILSQLNDEINHQNREISQQKIELEDLNNIKDKLFSIISHEFRSPLNSLKGTLALLKVGALNEQELNIISNELTDKINSTSIFLDNLLNWAKSQMQGINPKPITLDLKEVAEENVDFLHSLAEKKKVRLESMIKQPLIAHADPNMLHLVVRNLVSNAIKFSMRGGQIQVMGEQKDGAIIFSVKDNGIGMTKENQKLLFQIHSFTTRGTANERGTGLGLFISKNFIESNGGKIWVESEEGVGSTFFFSIPVARRSK